MTPQPSGQTLLLLCAAFIGSIITLSLTVPSAREALIAVSTVVMAVTAVLTVVMLLRGSGER